MVPRSRVDDVLQLMRRPAGTRLDPELARELAQRDGGIPTYITGRLSEVGNSTVLSASVIDVRSGATLAALTEKAADLTATPDATRRLSRQLRAALGETVAQSQSSGGLERVTTPSLKALRLYTDAYAAGAHNEWSAALTFASAAVDADPSFAAAHGVGHVSQSTSQGGIPCGRVEGCIPGEERRGVGAAVDYRHIPHADGRRRQGAAALRGAPETQP